MNVFIDLVYEPRIQYTYLLLFELYSLYGTKRPSIGMTTSWCAVLAPMVLCAAAWGLYCHRQIIIRATLWTL